MVRPTLFFVLLALVATTACGESRTAPNPVDAGAEPDSRVVDAGRCGAFECALSCDLQTGPDGCPVCRCEPGPTPECTTDDDCVVASNLAECCPGCDGAYASSVVQGERCLTRRGDPRPSDCAPTACPEIPCPDIDCALPARAVCNPEGRCMLDASCAPGDVFQVECVPECATPADCVVGRVVGGCCGSCPAPFHSSLPPQRDCIVGPGETAPAACLPPAEECVDVGCPDIFCDFEYEPTCEADGRCGLMMLGDP